MLPTMQKNPTTLPHPQVVERVQKTPLQKNQKVKPKNLTKLLIKPAKLKQINFCFLQNCRDLKVNIYNYTSKEKENWKNETQTVK